MTVAAEVWIRAAAEVWHDPREIDEENEDARGEYRDAEGPAPARQREPETEADDGDRGVLPAPEREQERERAPSVAPGVERRRSPHKEGDRKRLRVDVPDVDAVERRVDEVQEREGRRRPCGVAHRLETPGGVDEDRHRAGAEDDRLRENECASARGQTPEWGEEVEDGRKVVAPGVHGRKRHVGAVAVGDGPHDLDVVAEV